MTITPKRMSDEDISILRSTAKLPTTLQLLAHILFVEAKLTEAAKMNGILVAERDAAVNALSGMDPAAVAKLVDAAEKLMNALHWADSPAEIDELAQALANLKGTK